MTDLLTLLRTVHCCKLSLDHAAHGPILVNICATSGASPIHHSHCHNGQNKEEKVVIGKILRYFMASTAWRTPVVAKLEADSKIIGYIDNLVMNWRNQNISKVMRRYCKIQCTFDCQRIDNIYINKPPSLGSKTRNGHSFLMVYVFREAKKNHWICDHDTSLGPPPSFWKTVIA